VDSDARETGASASSGSESLKKVYIDSVVLFADDFDEDAFG
jgi:hypothetical protein